MSKRINYPSYRLKLQSQLFSVNAIKTKEIGKIRGKNDGQKSVSICKNWRFVKQLTILLALTINVLIKI